MTQPYCPINGIGYFLALREQKVPATLHVYPTGGHGWGFRDNFTYKRQWTGELEKWLRKDLPFGITALPENNTITTIINPFQTLKLHYPGNTKTTDSRRPFFLSPSRRR